jgi:hypothetical protein
MDVALYADYGRGAEEDKLKHTTFWRRAGLISVSIVFAGGCAANMQTPKAVEERATGLEDSQPQFDTAQTDKGAKTATNPRENAPGIVVHIDPTTGEFLPEPPAGGVALPQPADAARAPAPQLYEVPSPVPGGGMMIDLQGQFRTPLVATMGPDGKVTLKHQSTLPSEIEKK